MGSAAGCFQSRSPPIEVYCADTVAVYYPPTWVWSTSEVTTVMDTDSEDVNIQDTAETYQLPLDRQIQDTSGL